MILCFIFFFKLEILFFCLFVCSSDSGIFAMMFLEHWKSPRSSIFTLFKESDIPNLRNKFGNDLVFSAKNTGRKDLVTSYQFEVTFSRLLFSLFVFL